jgi:DNA-binding LacI/PurR family transcriptional regulator
MPITIKDIARAAGVSHTTVSRALRNHPALAQATIERIKKISDSMGYIPSAAARGLKTNRSNTLGVILSSIDDPYYSEILQGIEDELRDTGMSLFVAATHRDPNIEQSIVRLLGEQRVEGVIVGSTQFNNSHYRMLQQVGVPVAVINNQAAELYRYSIYHDDEYGSRTITEHLIQLKHQRIGFLGNKLSGKTNDDRILGYRNAMHQSGLPINPTWIHLEDNGSPEAGIRGAEYFLALEDIPSAIVCFNDMLAIGCMHKVQLNGLNVPRNISITGFDNIQFSEFTSPPLTTFHQPKREIGSAAARMLLDLLDSSEEDTRPQPKIVMIRGNLLIRESTATFKSF